MLDLFFDSQVAREDRGLSTQLATASRHRPELLCIAAYQRQASTGLTCDSFRNSGSDALARASDECDRHEGKVPEKRVLFNLDEPKSSADRDTISQMKRYVGIDFGTTNSAIAVAEGDAPPRLLPFPTPAGGLADTWRTVLYMEPGEGAGPQVSAGALAMGRYLETCGDGRFIQSVKSHLASRLFSKTTILNRNYSLEDLVSTYFLQMRGALDVDLGDTVVVGRPVRYWGAESEGDDERALTRMRAGLASAGFTDVVFEHEPTAAAAKYGAGLLEEELVLIADFGGGTSDFCLLKMGKAGTDILGTGGIGVGGDTFDGSIVDSVVAPLLGKGSKYSDVFGGSTEVPRSLFSNLRRWHHLAFLKSRKTMALLDRVLDGSECPERIARFIHVVENDLGLPLHQSVESCKVSLSSEGEVMFDFQDEPIAIRDSVVRADFDTWISSDLDTIDGVVDELLARCELRPEQVSRVFTTGGSSFVPAVRQRLEQRFPGRLLGGEELTSVALGLAARARIVFG